MDRFGTNGHARHSSSGSERSPKWSSVAMFPEHSYCYVPQFVVPAWLEARVPQIEDRMQIDNSRRHFEDAEMRYSLRQ
jgi:hypothetical protein